MRLLVSMTASSTPWWAGSAWPAIGVVVAALTLGAAFAGARYAWRTLKADEQDRMRVRLLRIDELLADMNEIASDKPEMRRDGIKPYMTSRRKLRTSLDALKHIGGPALPNCELIADYNIGVINEEEQQLFAAAHDEIAAALEALS